MTEQSEKKPKREYRKGNPLSGSERSRRRYRKLINDHKILKFYIPTEIKTHFTEKCEKEGVTQSEVMNKLIELFIKNGPTILDHIKDKC
ncbi:MAG: replication regulatory protein RepA [Candidatus Hamiltonella defensa (Ceratovacuna japonica)]